MPALQVKDCPTETYELLKKCSARENRSISQQTLTIIERYLGLRGPEPNPSPDAAHSASGPAPRTQEALGDDSRTRRRKAFDRVNALPSFDLPEGFGCSAELVAAAREDRW